MNEIITKLNEIEEKAETILCDARARKDELSVQLEQDKRRIDAEQDRLETEAMQQLEEKLTAEAKQKVEKLRRKKKEASDAFDLKFAEEKEHLAEQIMLRVIQ